MDVLAPTTMKNAVKCDTSCESQNPVSHQNFERSLHFFGSMSVGVSVPSTPFRGGDDRFQWKRVKMRNVSGVLQRCSLLRSMQEDKTSIDRLSPPQVRTR